MAKAFFFISFFLFFLSCSVKKEPDVLFDLITQSDLQHIYEFNECMWIDERSEFSFLQIRNNQADTIYATVYYRNKTPFLIINYMALNYLDNKYVINETRMQPFYPPGHTDTIMPFQNRIYPVYLPELKFNNTGLFLITPSIFAKEFKFPSNDLNKIIPDVKTPSIIYRIVDKNLMDWTQEITD